MSKLLEKFKGAKGNWYVLGDIIDNDMGNPIAKVQGCFNSEVERANAKLIASAPKLVKASLASYIKLQQLSNAISVIAVETEAQRCELRDTIASALGLSPIEVQNFVVKQSKEKESID